MELSRCRGGQLVGQSSFRLAIAVTALSGASSQTLAQQTDPPPAVQEVTVSAERTDAPLSKTASSVGVVGEAEIQSRGLTSLRDIVGVVAGVAVPNGDGNMPQAVGIRGVGVSIPAMSQAVGIYIDDVPLVRGYATALWDLPDIERIEILRGPQGTLYGENTTAGAVKIVSIDPSKDTAAWISASAGNFGARELHAYANGGIGDGPLFGSFAFSRRTNDGFGINETRDERVEKLDATQFRGKIKLEIDSSTNAVLALDGLQDRSDTNTVDFPLNAPNSAPRRTFTAYDAGAFKRNSGGLSFKLDHAFNDDIHFKSITALRAYKDDPTIGDYGGLAVQRYSFDQTVKQQAFSQEFQAQGKTERVSWTAGGTLVADRFDFDRFSTAFPLTAEAPGYSEAKTHLATTDIGLYGQARYALQPDTGITFGLRAYRTRQTGENDAWVTDIDQNRTKVIYSAPNLSTSSSGLLPRLVVDHQWTQGLFGYASVSQGQKFGGFNRAAQSEISADVATHPERVTTYELGGKEKFAGGAVTTNMALFYNDFRDYLASLNNSIVNGVLVTDSVLVNAGKAKTYGADFDVSTQLSRSTSATLSMEWLRSTFTAFENPTGVAGGNYVGNQLPYASPFSGGARIAHDQPFSNGSSATFDASLQYLRRSYSDVANTALLAIPSQTYFNLGALYTAPERHWSFSVRVKNLFDKTYVLVRDRIPAYGVDAAYYNPPRTLLMTARYDL